MTVNKEFNIGYPNEGESWADFYYRIYHYNNPDKEEQEYILFIYRVKNQGPTLDHSISFKTKEKLEAYITEKTPEIRKLEYER